MLRALRVVSVERGDDPRDFALVAFGGAGPLHACALAEELGCPNVLVPDAAGVLSALGLVVSDERRDQVRYVGPARRCRRAAGRGRGEPSLPRSVVRAHRRSGPELEERFHRAHEERYGYADRARAVELVAVRTAEIEPGPAVELVGGGRRVVAGPQLVELSGASCWVPDAWVGATDEHGTLVLERSG